MKTETWAAEKTARDGKTAEATDRDAVCERCGRPGAIEIAGRRICLACYDICGSCCLEFGDDDLWRQRDDL